jgi:capsular polysaccharide biosynthesis protein
MAGALQRLDPGGSVQDLRSRVQVKSITSNVFSISVQGATPAQAVLTANAVTDSYLSYVRSITPPGPGPAWVINAPSSPVEQPRSTRLLVSAGLGALLGALIGAIGAAFCRRGRRFGIR